MRFANHLGGPIGKAAQTAAGSALRQRATKHLQDVLCGTECFNQSWQIGACGFRLLRFEYEVSRLGTGLLIRALQVGQDDSEIAHCHAWRAVSEEFHDTGASSAQNRDGEAEASVNAARRRRTYRQERGHKGALAVRLRKLAIDGEKTLQGVAELAYKQSFQV